MPKTKKEEVKLDCFDLTVRATDAAKKSAITTTQLRLHARDGNGQRWESAFIYDQTTGQSVTFQVSSLPGDKESYKWRLSLWNLDPTKGATFQVELSREIRKHTEIDLLITKAT